MDKKADYLVYCGKGDRHFRTPHNTSARISYLRASKAFPDKSYPYRKSARLCEDAKQYKQAEFRYRKSSIIEPKITAIYNEWGLFLDRQGILEGQEELYRKALEINPKDSTSLCNLGAVFSEKCQYEEAIKLFKASLKENSRCSLSINNLGSMSLIIGEYEESVEYYKKALENNEEYFLPYMNMALNYMCLRKGDEAKENYEKGRVFMKRTPGKRGWLIREFKKLLDVTKQKLLEKDDLGNKGNKEHEGNLCHGLEEIIGLLESEDFP